MAHERDGVELGDIVLAMDLRIASQRQPGRRSDSRAARFFGPVTLSGEDQVEALCLLAEPSKIEVCVDGPPRAGMELRGQVIAQAIVDIEIEVEALPGNASSSPSWKCVTSTSPPSARWQYTPVVSGRWTLSKISATRRTFIAYPIDYEPGVINDGRRTTDH